MAQQVKNPPAMLETWVGKIPWRREQLPTPVFSLENSMDCIVHVVTESQTRLRDFRFTSLVVQRLRICLTTQGCDFSPWLKN